MPTVSWDKDEVRGPEEVNPSQQTTDRKWLKRNEKRKLAG
jgi:hypothetical protein